MNDKGGKGGKLYFGVRMTPDEVAWVRRFTGVESVATAIAAVVRRAMHGEAAAAGNGGAE